MTKRRGRRGTLLDAPICPNCGQRAQTVMLTTGFKNQLKNVCCHLWSYGRGSPLVDKHVHRARRTAHEEFDPLWETGLLSRSQAYKLLAEQLQVASSQCHMSELPLHLLQEVPRAVRRIRFNLAVAVQSCPTPVRVAQVTNATANGNSAPTAGSDFPPVHPFLSGD